MKPLLFLACLLPTLLLPRAVAAPVAPDIYAPDNIMAWCIVPFDAKHRGPEERAQMLETLEIHRLAYDWRAEQIPTFDAEVEAMKKHHVELTAWWFPTTLDADAKTILSVIERHKIHPQLWVMGSGEMLQPGQANDVRVVAEAARLKPIAEAADKLGCQVALYNHGGWFGEPENQLDVISRLETEGVKNVGIVYNFHHGHEHLPRFGELVRKMKPHLLAVNLNGMVRDGDKSNAKILPLGTGDQELEMLRVLQASGWRGPVGVIDHKPETDSEVTLRENLVGLKWLRAELAQPGSGSVKPAAAAITGGKFGPGKIGNAMDAGTGGLVLPGNVAYRKRPLIISAWTKLRTATAFNILVASDAKNSAEHWELYSNVKTGEFCVFQPGRGGNFASGVNITDDQWHQVSAVLEESRVRLYVDGKLAKEFPAQPLQGKPQPGGFAIGQLVEGGIGCDGWIDDVHVWQGHDPAASNQEIGAWPLETAPPSAPAPVAFFPDAVPLRPTEHPFHKERVNRDRMYDFYAKQALRFGTMLPQPELVASFPGLDSGRYGHWGNQNEEVWRDTSWNNMDAGGLQSGIISIGGKNVPRGVCVQLGAQRELAACFNTDTLTWEGVWSGGRLLHFDSFRWGMLAALVPDGKLETMPESAPAAKGSFTYHGFYRHGGKVIFAFAKDGQEWLETAWSEQGKFQRQRELAGGKLAELTKGGPAQWPEVLESKGSVGTGQPYAVDTLTFPKSPWKSLWHLGGHDFLPNGDAVVCTFEGEVWVVSGIDQTLENLRWRRFASGLSQPLGLKVVDGKIYVLGRDQLTRLNDLNNDGEADFYEAFSRAYETPVGGHDYLTGLETDAQGRFYFASGKLGINRIAADGKSTEVLATGFRNPNGLAVGPNGEVIAGVQEGDWTAASWLTELQQGGHYRHGGPRPGPLGDLPPTLFFPRGVENSCGGQVFVDSANFGLPQGSLVHLSWGYGTAFVILRETIEGQVQGCAMPLPVEFRSGAHRGRFRKHDGQLYVTGITGWGTYTPDTGCFQRMRYSVEPVQTLKAVQTHENGVLLEFFSPLEATAAEVKAYFAQQWNYLIGPAYGSDEYSVRWPQQPGHDVLAIRSAHLLADGKSLFLEIPQLQPCHQLHLHAALPQLVSQDFYLTLHKLGPAFTKFPGYQAIAKTTTGQSAGLVLDVEPSPFEQGAAGRAMKIQIAAGLQFAQRELRAKAGERISLTLENGDLMPHNWVLGKPGTLEKISDDADRNLANPKALSQSYVPQIPEVLASTRLTNPDTSTTIHFTLPAEKGDYPYLCTFPGHTKIMRGVLHVE
jgi:azurin